MYIIVVRLKRSRSRRLRNFLAQNGFVIYKVEKWTDAFSSEQEDQEVSEEELELDDKTFYLDEDCYRYECIYNGTALPKEAQTIFQKIEESPATLSYELYRK